MSRLGERCFVAHQNGFSGHSSSDVSAADEPQRQRFIFHPHRLSLGVWPSEFITRFQSTHHAFALGRRRMRS